MIAKVTLCSWPRTKRHPHTGRTHGARQASPAESYASAGSAARRTVGRMLSRRSMSSHETSVTRQRPARGISWQQVPMMSDGDGAPQHIKSAGRCRCGELGHALAHWPEVLRWRERRGRPKNFEAVRGPADAREQATEIVARLKTKCRHPEERSNARFIRERLEPDRRRLRFDASGEREGLGTR